MGEPVTALTVAEKSNGLALSQDKLELIRRTLAPDLTNDELALYGEVSKRYGLDPFRRQLYAIKRGGRVTFQTSIDGFRALAERSGKYRGQSGPFWCGADGQWLEVWLDAKPPKAAKVGVHHADFAEPLWAVARWDSYAQSTGLWPKMPDLMLAKVAEALALRKAFPEDLSGLYSDEEMAQADRPKESAPVRRAQGSDQRQGAGLGSPPSSAAIQESAAAVTPEPSESERKVATEPTVDPTTGEMGDIKDLYYLASKLPKTPQTVPQIDHLVKQHGLGTIWRRMVTAHKLQCGPSNCTHVAWEAAASD